MTQNRFYRLINTKDKELIYHWSNDIITRESSFNSKSITLDEHSEWFKKKIIALNSWYFICEIDGMPAAIIRFDIDTNETTIGINIAPNFRGKGLASLFLTESSLLYFKKNSNVLLAFIKKSNIPSIKSFEKAGFLLDSETSINNTEAFLYKKTFYV
jgi:UDP-2,4-diacetamido-2,4,6-trideoxy-beta-L-altropyranose hydrolase